MHAHSDRLEFAPPSEPAAVRAFALAIVAHVLLMIALTWGINWKRETETVAVEAELWSRVPQQAAPQAVQPPPPPSPAPQPKPEPVLKPEPVPKAEPPPRPPVNRDADIAVEREKRKQELALRKREEEERLKKLEARKQREELEREKKLEARKKQEELRREKLAEEKAEKLAEAKKAEERRRKDEQAQAAKSKQDEARLAQLRKENMARMMKGLEGGTGAPGSTGTAPRSSGISASYAGRVQARVRPHIVFTDDIAGNPAAEVEVRMSPDGTITNRRIVKSSGNKSWDEAVLRALDKTEVLPRDVDGRVPTPLVIEFKPKS